MQRKNIGMGKSWESALGYSQAVRVGSLVFVSGTTGINEAGEIVAQDDPYAQTVQAIKNIEKALHAASATLKDVVRMRAYVANIDDWERIGKAHGEFFRDIRPAATIVEVRRLIGPYVLVELEADAVISGSQPGSDEMS